MKLESQLKNEYEQKLKNEIMKELKLSNPMAVPRLKKIVINAGVGEAKVNSAILDDLVKDVAMITGQNPVVTKAKIAVSNFKIREGMPIGLKVTLRNIYMWYFLEKLIHIVLPRVKDFRGVSDKSFDGNGNYNFGLKEHLVFPEIDSSKVTKPHGLQITISTTGKNNEEAKLLLDKLGFPFTK